MKLVNREIEQNRLLNFFAYLLEEYVLVSGEKDASRDYEVGRRLIQESKRD